MSSNRIAILISGRGSNMRAFIDASERAELAAEIAVVISNKPEAPGLELASKRGITTACIDHREYDNREAFDQALCDCLNSHAIDLVILAGFMRILTPVFIDTFQGRLLNIHPSLLPKYPGLNTHQRALDAGDTQAGVTVHFVTNKLDGGPPILQATVPIESGDTADSLSQRVIELEHKIYPIAATWFLDKRLQLTKQGAVLDGQPIPTNGIQYSHEPQ